MNGPTREEPSPLAGAALFAELAAECGLDRLPCGPPMAAAASSPVAKNSEATEANEGPVESAPVSRPVEARASTRVAPSSATVAEALTGLAQRIASCRRCGLWETRQKTVPGEGSAQARVMFVGEAPGADEDRSGRPFVGRAGQLLTRIIEGGMGLRREEVFIANVLKCRPPGNRDPKPEEKECCTPFLEEQIAHLRPELLIALGRHAANHLLGRNASLTSLRGKLHSRADGGPPVLVTFHPAYLLRNPGQKAACWQDIQLGMHHLDLPLPQRPTS